MHTFRFGYQALTNDPSQVTSSARAAEAAGFDVFHTFDHVGVYASALAPLAAAAAVTSRIRLCPLVLNNDLHHPVTLAQELATVDHLSGGRVEVGIGAGHAFPEYAAIGQPFDPPGVRKARLAESVGILRRLLDGEEVSHDGEHYHLREARTLGAVQSHVPILVGVHGRAALAHAAAHADIIGLTMTGRTLADGRSLQTRWEAGRLDTVAGWIREQAGARWPGLELNALVQRVVITDDRMGAAEDLAGKIEGLTVEDALATPFLALGTHDEIAAHLRACRERWNISYYSVRDIGAFAPVIERLRAAGSPR